MILSKIAEIGYVNTKKEKAEIIDEIIEDGYKELIDIIFDKDIRFYVATKNIEGSYFGFDTIVGKNENELNSELLSMLKTFAKGELRGNEALILCDKFEIYLNDEEREVFHNILENKLRLGIGITDINKYCKGTSIKQFEVMYAKQFDKAKIDKTKQWIIQPKIDGNRCIGIKRINQEIQFFTRTGKPITTLKLIEDEINSKLMHMEFMIDGEIEAGSLEETGSIRRKEDSIDNAIYTVFGIYDIKQWESGIHTDKYSEILEYTKYLLDYNKFMNIRQIYSLYISNLIPFEDAIAEINNKFLEQGYEGSVIKTLDHVYQPSSGSRRSNDWIKIKPWSDSDAIILEVLEGDGMFQGSTGKFNVKWNNIEFELATGKLTEEQRKYIWENQDKYVGRVIEFKYQTLSKYGVPRHAHAIKIRMMGD